MVKSTTDRPAKKPLTIRIDRSTINYFKSQGPGYQTRLNAVLKAFVDAQKSKIE